MKRTLSVVFTAFLSIAAIAAETATEGTPSQPEGGSRKALIERMHNKRTGGNVRRPGVQRGSVAFLNAAPDKAPSTMLDDLAARLRSAMKIDIRNIAVLRLPDRGMAAVMKENGVNAAVFLTWNDDCDVPMLYAPEQNWAVVNMRLLAEGVDDETFRLRLIKQATRAFAYVCGAGGSMGGEGIMDVSSVKALDHVEAELSIDILARFDGYLKGIGVTPWEEVSYKVAVQEGWAPAPTNEMQQAIWDQVHAIPKNPMKIEFDPKKGR